MRIINAAIRWFIVSPGMHKQPKFPARLFFARLGVLLPLFIWAGWAWIGGYRAAGLAIISNFFVLLFQATTQELLDKKNK